MQVSLNKIHENPLTYTWNYLKKPNSKVAALAASILLSSLYMGYHLFSTSPKWGEAVMVIGASAGWGIFFSYSRSNFEAERK